MRAKGAGTRPLEHGGVLVASAHAGPFQVCEVVYDSTFGQSFHRHEHATLTFVLDGSFAETVVGDVRRYGRHAVLLKPRNLLHRCSGEGSRSRCLSLEIASDALPSLGAPAAIWDRPGYLDGAPLVALARRLTEELHAHDASAPLALEGLCMEMIAAVHRWSVQPRGKIAPPWLDDAMTLLRDAAAHLTPSTLADQLDLEPSELIRGFRTHVGESLASVMRKARVQHGCELLCQSDLSLTDVAEAAGFFDQSHFTRVFRRYTGTTPGAYRRRFRERGC